MDATDTTTSEHPETCDAEHRNLCTGRLVCTKARGHDGPHEDPFEGPWGSDADTTPDGAERSEGLAGWPNRILAMAVDDVASREGSLYSGRSAYRVSVGDNPKVVSVLREAARRLRDAPPEGLDRELDQTIRRLEATARDTPDPYDDAHLTRVWRKQLRMRAEKLRVLRTPTPDPPPPCPVCGENEAKRLTTVTLRPCTECADEMDEPSPPERCICVEPSPDLPGDTGVVMECPVHGEVDPPVKGENVREAICGTCDGVIPMYSNPCEYCGDTNVWPGSSPPVEEGERGASDTYAEIGAALVLAYEDGRRLQDVVVREDVLRKIKSLADLSAPDAREGEGEGDAIRELRQGNGLYYVAQERWGAPGISGDGGDWPDTIPAPHTDHGRLVKRMWPGQPEHLEGEQEATDE